MDITDLPEKNEDAWFTCGSNDCQNYQLYDEAQDPDVTYCNKCWEQIQAEYAADMAEMRREENRDELMMKLQDEYDGTVNEDDDRSDIQKMNDDAKRMGWAE